MTTEIIEQPKKVAMDVNSIFIRTWKRFIENLGSLLGVFGMSMLFAIGGLIIGAVLGAIIFFSTGDRYFDAVTLILIGVVFVVWLAFFAWIMSTVNALYYNTIAHKKPFGEIWKMSYPKALGLLGTGAIVGLAVLGGFFLFIIPGIWIGTLLVFSYAVYTLENKTWQDAIRKSITLVSYEFWNVFVPFLIIFVVAILFTMLGSIGSVANIGLGIFATVLAYELYVSLSANYPQADIDAKKQSLLWVAILSVFSFLTIVGLVAAGTFFAGSAIANGFDPKTLFDAEYRSYGEEFEDTPFDYVDYQLDTISGDGVNSIN